MRAPAPTAGMVMRHLGFKLLQEDSRFFQIGVSDELDSAIGDYLFGLVGLERLQFHAPRFEQSRACIPEVSVAVTRMADQFPCAFRKRVEDRSHLFLAELAGGDDSDGTIG